MLNSNRVAAVVNKGARYPATPPFHPDEAYPEYPFGPGDVSSRQNNTYALVRESLRCLGLDADRFGQTGWNPLGDLVRPGNTVVLKPNWAVHEHRRGGDLDCIITHVSVIRAVADYVLIALEGRGRVIIADAPLPWTDFHHLLKRTGSTDVALFLANASRLPVEIRDLRKLRHVYTDHDILGSRSRVALDGDPEGYSVVNLGEESEFSSLPDLSRLYGADYDRKETIRHHCGSRHEYLISRTVLKADVVVGLPKMKVHRKVGATLNLKNLVGINGDKNYLPHFQIGSPSGGGDEFPDSIGPTAKSVYGLRRKLVDHLLTRGNPFLERAYVLARDGYHLLKGPLGIPSEVVQAGDWYGNDTAWRMVLDLNKVFHYAAADGRMSESPQRKFFSIVDGIVAGEAEGPLVPDPRPCGVLVAGENPLAVDLAALRLMGLDWQRLKLYRRALELSRHALLQGGASAVEWVSNDPSLLERMSTPGNRVFALRPSRGWAGHCEISEYREGSAG